MRNCGETIASGLSLLLFSVGGVFFGIDADQIAEISAYKGEQAEDLFWFHEEIGYGDKTVTYNTPTIVTVGAGNDSSYRLVIDSMEDITEFGNNEIRLLPALLESLALRKGVWGVLPRAGKIILLLDIKILIREKKQRSTD